MDKLFPAHLGLIGRVGYGALLLALALAPGIGGYPAGTTYGADVPLSALRALVCVGALCLAFAPPAPSGGALPAGASVPLDRVARGAVWGLAALTAISLLVHSQFLTSPVLLFAMLPATLDWVCYALLVATCARLGRDDRAAVGPLVGALAVGAAWTAISGVREYGQSVQAGQAGQRVTATFFAPNFAAGLLALMLPVVVAWFCGVRERLGALALGALGALMFGTLVATGSRAGIATGALGLGIAFLAALVAVGPRRLPWARVAALLVALAALGFGFRSPLTSRAASAGGDGGGGQEHSGAFRTYTRQGTLAMAKANPALGTGPGTFTYRYPPYAPVQKTDLAHSSYFQLAAEQGFPALAVAAVALAATWLTGASALRRRGDTAPAAAGDDDGGPDVARLLLCGLLGGLAAGAARGWFDSEWSILGNALPFWAVTGLILGLARANSPPPDARTPFPPRHDTPAATPGKAAVALAVPAALGLIVSLLLLRAAQTVDAAQARIRDRQRPAEGSVWPPDPSLLFWTGRPEEAARVEPTGKRYFQWARTLERSGDIAGAVPKFQEAVRRDPNNLQALRALAETQTAAGDSDGALATWQELIRRFEGPAGRVRAIPELPETYPAYAYAAIGDAARARGDRAAATDAYEKAAQVVEAYSRTPHIYQQMEVAGAAISGADVSARRQEVRDLYRRVMRDYAALEPSEAGTSQEREAGTLARLDAFVKPESLGMMVPGGQAR